MLRDRNDSSASDAATIALRALTFQLADENYRSRFLAQCGVAPQDLARMIENREFLAGILDALLRDESMLLAFCTEAGMKPRQVADASNSLSAGAND